MTAGIGPGRRGGVVRARVRPAEQRRGRLPGRVCRVREGRHCRTRRVCQLSTALEDEAIATAENEATQTDWRVISVEDWALIRRLVADGVPQRQVARDWTSAGKRCDGRWPRMVHRRGDPEFGYGLAHPDQAPCALTSCESEAVLPTPAGPAPSLTTSAPAPVTTQTATPTPSPAVESSPSSTPESPSPTPSPPPTLPPAPSPSNPSDEPTAEKQHLRLAFTTGGGTTTRGQRVPIRLRVTDTNTGESLAGHRVLIRGWRHGSIVIRSWVTTDQSGSAVKRIRVRATTRFDLRSPSTAAATAATSASKIRWRVR